MNKLNISDALSAFFPPVKGDDQTKKEGNTND